MNKAILLGNLSRDVEMKQAGGTTIGTFTIAVNGYAKQGGGEPRVDFIDCVAFNKTAENIGKYFKKGSKIALCGRIQVDPYTDKQGNKRKRTVVIVNEFFFCASKAEETQKKENRPAAKGNDYYEDPEGIDEEDLPF